MGQSYLKNAALLTGADVLLRLAGMGLRIYLANALGGEGMGLYQLVLAVYALFVTLATAGVSVAATRLMAEELARGRAQARGMLVRLAGTGLLLGAAAMAAQYGLAGAAARWWLGDVRAAGALRVSAFGMPWMALSAVLRGFFIARRRVEPNVLSQLVEQSVRIGIIWYALEWGNAQDVSARCTAVLAATAVSEAVSTASCCCFTVGRRCVRSAQKGPTACRPCPAALGDPVAGGGRAVPCQRPAHGGEHAGARLPDGLPAGCRGPQCRGGPVRQPEGDGPASAYLPLRAAGEPFGAADA